MPRHFTSSQGEPRSPCQYGLSVTSCTLVLAGTSEHTGPGRTKPPACGLGHICLSVLSVGVSSSGMTIIPSTLSLVCLLQPGLLRTLHFPLLFCLAGVVQPSWSERLSSFLSRTSRRKMYSVSHLQDSAHSVPEAPTLSCFTCNGLSRTACTGGDLVPNPRSGFVPTLCGNAYSSAFSREN